MNQNDINMIDELIERNALKGVLEAMGEYCWQKSQANCYPPDSATAEIWENSSSMIDELIDKLL